MLFLDEPTTGLDPQARARMWDEIRRLQATTARRSSSRPTTSRRPTRCADRLAIIDHGTIVAEGTADELKSEIAGDVITLGVDGPTERVLELVAASRTSARPPIDGEVVRLYVDKGETAVPQLLRVARRRRPGAADDRPRPAEPRRRVPAPDRPLAARGTKPAA